MARKPEQEKECASDAELVQACRRGDKRAFVEVVARHQAMVCGISFGILNDFAASEDAAQDAFLTAWRKIQELRDPAKLCGWLAQIARNAALAQARARRPEEPFAGEHESEDGAKTPDEATASEEEAVMVRAALEELPETYRIPLVLFYREGQSTRAIAEALEIGEDAARQRLARGREMLRARMEGVVERVLIRTRPNAIFTMMVATAIGALATPAAIAATAFSASAGGAAAAGKTSSILTAMSTTKAVAVSAAVLAVAFVPIGYQFGRTPVIHRERMGPDQNSLIPPVPAPAARPSFETSALFAEWRALHEKYGTNAAAMPRIFQAVDEIKDLVRHRAFQAALIAEWAQVDPQGGLDFCLQEGRNDAQREQFFEEWFKADPNGAIDALLAKKGAVAKKAESLLHDALPRIARTAPGRVAEIAERLPKSEYGPWGDTAVVDAFAILTERDLESTRETARKLAGPSRELALAGVARTWAKSDIDAAMQWVKGLPGELDRDEIIRNALVGLASADPLAALQRISSVPPGGKAHYFASTTAARVLHEAAARDFDATLTWVNANAARLSQDDYLGLADAVTERFNADPAEFLTRHSNDGSLKALLAPIGSALLNHSAGNREQVWTWLRDQPPSPEIAELRRSVINSAAYQDTGFALRLAAELPETEQGRRELAELARGLASGGRGLSGMDELYANAPERLKPELARAAFETLDPRTLEDPAQWLDRVSLLPKAEQAAGIESVARAWAGQRPEESAAWAETLPVGDTRERAFAAITGSWIARDERGAAEWIRSLTPGADRDRATEELVYKLGEKYPREALQWTLAIADEVHRTRAAFSAAQAIAANDPAMAREWAQSVPMRPESKAQLEAQVEKLSQRGGVK